MRTREFHTEQWLPSPPSELFPFFGNAANLEALTPPWLNFRILTPQPITMHEGTLIDYQLRISGIPIRWRTRINTWEPPFRFVDEQIRGPYRIWIHEHAFEAKDGGTLIRDHVRYAVLFDFLIHRLVRLNLESIFRFRSEALIRKFGKPAPDDPEG